MSGEASNSSRRLESIDVVRGLIMILMALDHVRDFFGAPGVNPTNLATSTAPLFLTRWITHFCAPVFFLLTGTGAFLSLRKKSRAELSRFLLTRGLWMIFLELTVIRCLGFQFNADYRVTMLVVIWALGWAMIALSALVWLPAWIVTTIGVAMIAGHNAFDGVRTSNPLWSILHAPGFVLNNPSHVLFVSYPLIPWIGVTAAGFGLGQIYRWSPARRRGFLLWAGLVLTGGFVILRSFNQYGDPFQWGPQRSSLLTVLSFLNATKYPPSLLFLLMTLGPALLLLRAVDGRTPAVLRPALTFGQVPFFYFLLHLPFIHLLAVLVCAQKYGAVHWIFESPDLAHYPFSAPPGWGFSLPVVYGVWMFVVVALYPFCRWFAGVKRRGNGWWLGYL